MKKKGGRKMKRRQCQEKKEEAIEIIILNSFSYLKLCGIALYLNEVK
jgi:hypothetical protein